MGLDDITQIVQGFIEELRKLYGEELEEVFLYGSYARGEANDGSDIDLMIILKGEVSFTQEIERMNEPATEMLMKYGELISLYPISLTKFNQLNTPLLMNAQKEGVSVWKM